MHACMHAEMPFASVVSAVLLCSCQVVYILRSSPKSLFLPKHSFDISVLGSGLRIVTIKP